MSQHMNNCQSVAPGMRGFVPCPAICTECRGTGMIHWTERGEHMSDVCECVARFGSFVWDEDSDGDHCTEDSGWLVDSNTTERLRPATEGERRASDESEARG